MNSRAAARCDSEAVLVFVCWAWAVAEQSRHVKKRVSILRTSSSDVYGLSLANCSGAPSPSHGSTPCRSEPAGDFIRPSLGDRSAKRTSYGTGTRSFSSSNQFWTMLI